MPPSHLYIHPTPLLLIFVKYACQPWLPPAWLFLCFRPSLCDVTTVWRLWSSSPSVPTHFPLCHAIHQLTYRLCGHKGVVCESVVSSLRQKYSSLARRLSVQSLIMYMPSVMTLFVVLSTDRSKQISLFDTSLISYWKLKPDVKMLRRRLDPCQNCHDGCLQKTDRFQNQMSPRLRSNVW